VEIAPLPSTADLREETAANNTSLGNFTHINHILKGRPKDDEPDTETRGTGDTSKAKAKKGSDTLT